MEELIDTTNFQQIATEIEVKLIEKDNIRDELLKLSNAVIKLAGQCIEAFHTQRIEQSLTKLNEAKKKVEEMWSYINKDIEVRNTKFVGIAFQEYTEAQLLLNIIKNKKFKTPKELQVTEEAYILGIADLIGELRRHILERLVEGETDTAKRYYKLMREIYGVFLQIDYGKNLIPEFRRKKDTARILVEKTLSDLIISSSSKKIEDKIMEMANVDFE